MYSEVQIILTKQQTGDCPLFQSFNLIILSDLLHQLLHHFMINYDNQQILRYGKAPVNTRI